MTEEDVERLVAMTPPSERPYPLLAAEYTHRIVTQPNNGWVGISDGTVHAFLWFSHDRKHNALSLDQLIAVPGRETVDALAKRMIAELIAWLPRTKRDYIDVLVREDDLPCQLFYRELNFQHCKTLPKWFPDDRDGYVLRYRQKPSEAESRGPRCHSPVRKSAVKKNSGTSSSHPGMTRD